MSSARFTGACLLLSVAACGGSIPESKPVEPSAVHAPVTKSEPTKGAIRRTKVSETVQQGLGAFLQKVTVDDRAVFSDGKFHGFRIIALSDELRGSELKAGDVITRVNGMPIERPDQALEVFRSLDVASELRVDYERDGVPHALRFPIVDDGPPSPAAPQK